MPKSKSCCSGQSSSGICDDGCSATILKEFYEKFLAKDTKEIKASQLQSAALMSEVQGKVAKIEARQETSSQQVEANSSKLEEQAKDIRELRASLRRQEEANKETKVGFNPFLYFPLSDLFT